MSATRLGQETALRWITGVLVGLVIATFVVVATGLWIASPQPGPVATSVSPMSTPSASRASSEVTSHPVASPSSSASATPSQASVAMADPAGNLKSLKIMRGNEVIVDTINFAPRVENDKGDFLSQCGKVAWWDANESWPKPGQLSKKLALIGGHVMCYGKFYELKHLQPDPKTRAPGSRQGDLLYITYDSGDVVVAEAIEDSQEVDKRELTSLDRHLCADGTYDDATAQCVGNEGRMISLSTCDRTGEIRPDGHAAFNVAQLYRVKEVIKYA